MSDLEAVKPFKVFFVVGEESGDQLGAEVIKALRASIGDRLQACGLGGERMAAQGVQSIFPLHDIAVMGITAVLERLPTIIRRVHQTVDAVIAEQPDLLLIIDSPDFTHNVAKRVRKKAPHIRVVDYVSPSVWAWRPGRAKKMAAYVDQLLALLPFEPEAHKRLGGPPCDYVGHPLIERLADLRPAPGERAELGTGRKQLVVLPGSRTSEVSRLLEPFGQAVELVCAQDPDVDVIIPAVPHQEQRIRDGVVSWKVQPRIVTGEAEKFAALRQANAALAASGTVSLELAIAGVPMVIAYKLDWFFRRLKQINRFVKIVAVDTIVLPNLVLGDHSIKEYIEDEADPEVLSQAVLALLSDSAERRAQLDAFSRIDEKMRLPEGESQAGKAARIILETAGVSA
ncbi:MULTISPECIES: lipid-A-disaccharide synthase [unclassified Pseudovibrio]|uniref:lipid-A-disaccharide synthase n=1 Tax=unclassified Pseudovibrio TaxID=2627060 RepID=UPI0007AE551C|nr:MULTISPECIES: lipid-A-disaccharide synthase [unclassified Pseudovibrio]KZL00342.1 Lipid-A-disaccharide synthase [Pseudovibrio sp. W74]KZL07342.1 Lipid-A-disaccharide synthase [Pseudovibrio sp. Ad14]